VNNDDTTNTEKSATHKLIRGNREATEKLLTEAETGESQKDEEEILKHVPEKY